MEGDGGAAIMDLRVRNGLRQSVFRSYAFPYLDRPNLTVLCHALVARLFMSGKQAGGVEIIHDGKVQRIAAGVEVLLSLGAIHTPKVLMLFGIGDQAELKRLEYLVCSIFQALGKLPGPRRRWLCVGISATALSTQQHG